MPERVFCSEQRPDEPLAGTADRVDVWVLLEYRPAWRAKALDQAELDPAIRRWLDAQLAALAAAGLKARPQLVRQPELDSDRVRLLVGVGGRLLVFSGSGYGFLQQIDLAAVAAHPTAHPALDQPQYFVCTNGQRDVCCARFGLPAYAALRERVGDRAWQVTHLGGHRFAPNVLVLPQGALYGRVTPDAVHTLVDGVEAGELVFPLLRGRTAYPPPVQAAEAAAARQGLMVESVADGGASTTVRFRGPDGIVEVAVEPAAEPMEVLKSCGDPSTGTVTPYLPVSRG
ncbi:MAG: sucrase ferredoxin [Pseudomonadales bacterium]